jgi:4-aminobutyrate aminotransferase/(S)-3-amino-2-methylpropionate transaminase
LEEFVRENEAEDRRCLQLVEEIFEIQRKKNHPISGVVIEPIQAEGGDNHASKEFFQVSKN